MPSFTATQASLRIAGGSAAFVPARFSAAAAVLRIISGSGDAVGFTVGNVVNESINTPKLDRITRQEQITEENRASQRFQLIWQRTMEAIEGAFGGQQGQITDLANIVARLEAAEAKADAAVAQATATATEDAIAKSYPSEVTLSASSDGTITISAHTRIYGDGTSVAVNGGSLSGWSQGQFVQVYYDDAGRAGGAVAYQGTTEVIAQAGARHIVGGVAIPLAGEVPIEGNLPLPPGYVPDTRGYQ